MRNEIIVKRARSLWIARNTTLREIIKRRHLFKNKEDYDKKIKKYKFLIDAYKAMIKRNL